MLNCNQFRKLIIQPALKRIELYSQEAEDLLVGTCGQESKGGTYLFQQGTNPDLNSSLQKNILAVGIYQMEPRTHDDLWDNYIFEHEKLAALLKPFAECTAYKMVYDLYYATIMARIFYLRVPEPTPKPQDSNARIFIE